MERQPSFSRIIGGTEEQRKALEKEAEEMVLLSGEDIFGEELLDPTEEEKELINQAVAYSNFLAASYGSTRAIDPKRVFVLRRGAVVRHTDGNISGGVHNSFKQSTGIERNISPIAFAMTVVHESCHGASYSSAQILEDGTDQPYRQGISMRERNGDNTYFKQAEEAIVTICARKFHDEILANHPRYQQEIARTNEIKLWLASYLRKKAPEEELKGFLSLVDDIIALPNNEKLHKMLSDSSKDEDVVFGYFQGFYQDNIKSGDILRERSKERMIFDEILERISQQSGETITKQELFDDFAKAHFTGNYLPLAKKIEGIMGKGSFREIAGELGNTKA
jgi:hypothetical protein